MNKKLIKILIVILIIFILGLVGALLLINNNGNNKEKQNKEPTKLNHEQLNEISNYLSKEENYGFALSYYNKPEEIDLEQVFYGGAGIDEKVSDEERVVFYKMLSKKSTGMNVIGISKEKAENLYKAKTGMEIQNIEERLPKWTYLTYYKKICIERSDSNYVKITCTEGTVDDNKYTVNLSMPTGKIIQSTLTLKKKGEDYIFISNINE